MKAISNYVSAAILLAASLMLAGTMANIIRGETENTLVRETTTISRVSTLTLSNGSTLILVNKTSGEPLIIGNYTVLANTTSIILIQTNSTVDIVEGGKIIEAP
jgi:hypothetical protein